MSRLTRYEPNSLVNSLRRLIDDDYSPLWATDASKVVETTEWMPAVDIHEEANRMVIHADLPGLDEKEINISVKDNLLSITGERKTEKRDGSDNFSRIERVYGSFCRRFSLPDTADTASIQAQMKKGVLEVVIPKKEAAKSRKIEIKGE